MLAHDLGFMLAHLLGDLADGLIDGGVEVAGLGAGVDGDVIAAMEQDLGDVTVFFDIEDDLGVDDARVIEVEALDLFPGVINDGIGDGHMAAGDFDFGICVGDLHGFLRFTF